MGLGLGFEEERNIYDERLACKGGLLGLDRPASAHQRVENVLQSAFLSGVVVNQLAEERAVGPSVDVGTLVNILQDLFPDRFILDQKFTNAGIGVERDGLNALHEQLAEG